MVLSSPRELISWTELSRPTVSGNTAWGKSTVSRTGNTGSSGACAAAALGARSELRVVSAMSRWLMDESPPQKDATTAEGAEITNQRREIVIERSAESKCISRGGGIDAENLDEVRYLGEMGHSLAGAGLVT